MKTIVKKYGPAVTIPVIYLVVILLTSKISYTTVDDVPMMHILAGYKTGNPLGWTLYLNPILSKSIALLYRVMPFIQWYTIIQLVIICISMMAINQCVMKPLEKEDERFYVTKRVAVSILLDGIFCWMIIRLHFYNPAIMAGCAAICIVLIMDITNRRWYIYLLLVIFFWSVSILYTYEVTKALFCYLGLAILYKLVVSINKTYKNTKKIVIRMMIIVFLTVITAIGLHSLFLSNFYQTNGKEYVEWNAQRIAYQDYPITTYYEDSERYEKQGWNEDLYVLSRCLYYMDEKINANTLKGILKPDSIIEKGDEQIVSKPFITQKKNPPSIKSDIDIHYIVDFENEKGESEKEEEEKTQKEETKQTSITHQYSEAYKKMYDLFDSEREAKGLHALMIGLFVAGLLLFSKSKKSIANILLVICSFIGTFILCMYLCILGRFPIRAYLVVAIPGSIIMIYGDLSLIVSRWRKLENEGKKSCSIFRKRIFHYIMTGEKGLSRRSIKNSRWMVFSWISFGLSIIIISNAYSYYSGLNQETLRSEYNTAIFQNEINKEDIVYLYAQNNKDKILVYDWSSFFAYEPFPKLNCGDLDNLFPWGSSRYNSYAFQIQLNNKNLDHIQSEDFANEYIFFITNNTSNLLRLRHWLNKEYQIDTCYLVEELNNNFCVYKFFSLKENYSDKFLEQKELWEEVTDPIPAYAPKFVSNSLEIMEGIQPGEEKTITIKFGLAFHKYPNFVYSPLCSYGYGGYITGHIKGVGLDWATIVIKNAAEVWLPITINWMAYGE